MAEASINSGGNAGMTRSALSASRLTSVKVMLAVALTLALVLGLNFSSRIKLDRDLGRIHTEIVSEIDDLLADQRALLEQLEYVKSDAYVEFWARDEGKMVREGEVLVLPRSLAGQGTLPTAPRRLVAFETTAPEPENWELWWALFFDGPPPGE